MARKKRGAARSGGLFPEVEKIIAQLNSEPTQETVVVVVPSHDRRSNPLGAARMGEWATAGMRVLADLYRGATAFRTFQGIYKTDTGEYLIDEPILLESYASHEDIQDPANLTILVEFAKRMGKELNQAAIMLVIGRAMIYIEDYGGV